jgi:hypothetical protein
MTDHYNNPADFVLFFTAVGFTITVLTYLPVTIVGILRTYFMAGSKPS